MDVSIVQLYRTEDNRVFDNREEAKNHARVLKIWQKSEELINRELYDGMTKDTAICFIESIIPELMEIAQSKVTVERVSGSGRSDE